MTSTGLVLGKFAPLHRGHQLLMDTATEQTQNQIFVVYDSPSVTQIPLPVRAEWIRKLYPDAEVLEAWGGPEEVGLETKVREAQEEFLKELLGSRQVTHFFSSEKYGDSLAESLGASHHLVDENRQEVPISGTELRLQPNLGKEYLSPVVLRDLVRKVVFLGAPSTGKSTICEALALKFNSVFVAEYGREYWEKFAVDRRLELWQLEEIAEGHIQREENAIAQASESLFIDTDASTTEIFAKYYHGASSSRLSELANRATKRYDLTFLCLNDFPYADTPDRSGEANQNDFHRRIKENLRAQQRPFIELGGTVAERIEKVAKVLTNHKLFCNPMEWSESA